MTGNGQRSLAFNLVLGLVLELILYGIYIVAFAMSMYILLQKQYVQRTSVSRLIMFTGILLFCMITVQTVIMTVSLFTPFSITHADQDAAMVMANSTQTYVPMIAAMLGLYFSELFISNFLMIYRVWIVSQRSWMAIVIPVLSLAASIICEGIFISLRHDAQHVEQDFGGAQWATIGLSFDVFVNIYCTALLAHKIWRSQQRNREVTTYLRSFSSFNVMAIIIETAALYTCTTLLLLITYATGIYGTYTLRQLHCTIPGIAYCLVIIRFGMGGAFKESPQLSTFSIPSQPHLGSHGRGDDTTQPVEINIHLERKVETHDMNGSSFIDLGKKEHRGETA